MRNLIDMKSTMLREVAISIGMVIAILSGLWAYTGSWPPLVVVESNSMIHSEQGEVGSIDAGDLVLVNSPRRTDQIVTYVESMQEGNQFSGHQSHGMPGDVIIYQKNGGTDTPVIHRAILKAVRNETGGWDVPGTDIRAVEEISLIIDYPCYPHGGNLRIDRWIPSHEGYLTTGDNEKSNGCRLDQLRATDRNASDQYIRSQGLKDQDGNPVLAVKDEWVIGVASTEIPWLGSIKLLTTGAWPAVSNQSWTKLSMLIGVILVAPVILDAIRGRSKESGKQYGDKHQGEDE